MSEQQFCPVCQGDMDDTRHVGVECFYEVHEVVPSAEKRPFFSEVEETASIWGTTRRYPAGTKDKRRVIKTGENSSKIETDQVPIPAIRLYENHLYRVTCCKSCRGDFLQVFGKWSRGELRPRRQDDDEANIPVRVNGATVMMTRTEYDQFKSTQ
jgi:hypothetical protein